MQSVCAGKLLATCPTPAQPTADTQRGITVHGRFTQLVEPAARSCPDFVLLPMRDEVFMELPRDGVRKARRDLAFDVDAFQMVNDPKCDTHTGDTEISTIFADSPSSSKHRNRPLKGDVHLRSIYPGHMFFDEWVVFG
ncbi:hypothetical protein I306_03297 [Cryptococcus gattii EJB2]|uniref:Uncharacterized protein n=1 Tax=Cryptococcus gattii EJB2 TaxID=1296103 RepID=A0ABR5BVN9_9TREE|nr:hypothetical protein I306_03297 [Cryptococcus gattii EJB2]